MEFNSYKTVRVDDIILDSEHIGYSSDDDIGKIYFSNVSDPTPSEPTQVCFTAKPLFFYIKQYPVKNETVVILNSNVKEDFYSKSERIQIYYLPPVNWKQDVNENALPTISNDSKIDLGKYFDFLDTIRPLKTYEGDTLLEGRFGNSIRFGSTLPNNLDNPWSDVGNIGDPITIIRNGQTFTPESPNNHLLEDINEDPSSVYLCSNQQLTNFIPASFNDESYGEDLFKLKVQNEVTFKDDDIPLNTNEDVVLTPADNLDAETNYSELNNLTTNNQTDINALETKYDNAETDTNPVSATQDVSLDFEQDDSVDYDMDLNSSTG